MKKSYYLLLTIIIILSLSVFVLTACGDNENDQPTKSINNLTINSAGGAYVITNGSVNIPVGADVSFTSNDLSVTVNYTDGTSEIVTDFSIYQNVDFTVPGTYTVTITYKGVDGILTVYVYAEDALLPVLPNNMDQNYNTINYEYEYSGSEVDIIAKLDALMQEGSLSQLIIEGKVLVTEDTIYSRINRDAGYYITELKAADGYVFSDGMDSRYYWWNITKKVIPVPTAQGSKSFTYDGTEKSLQVVSDYNEVITYAQNGMDTRKGINAGDYTCYAEIKENYQNNYTFANNLTFVQVDTFTIDKAVLPAPVVTNALSSSIDDNVTLYHFDYTGNDIAYTTNLDDYSGIVNIENVTIQNVYSYAYWVRITVNDACWYNYRYEDNVSVASERLLHIMVDPIDYVIPQAYSSNTWDMEGVYDFGYDFDYALDSDKIGFTSATQAWLEESGVYDQESRLEYADTEGYDFAAGEYQIHYNFYHNSNYKPLAITANVSVAKLSLNASYDWDKDYHIFEDNQDKYIDIYGDYFYNGLAQVREFKFSSVWDQYGDITVNTYYGATQGNYDMQNPIVSAINAGYYKTVATIGSTDASLQFVDYDTGDVLTEVEIEWQIEKARMHVFASSQGTTVDYYNHGCYSFYTGVAKTLTFSSAYFAVERYHGNSVLARDFSHEYNWTVSDYIDFDYSFVNYKHDGNAYVESDDMTSVGRYQSIMNVALKSNLEDNYEIVEYPIVYWVVLDTTIDASAMVWVNENTYEYGSGVPYVDNIPEGLEIANSSAPHDVGNQTATIELMPINADGYNNVTVIYPTMGWAVNGTHAESSTSYEVTKKYITRYDFYVTIDGHREDVVPYNGEYRSPGYGTTLNINDFGALLITDMSREWDPTGQIYAGRNQNEVGQYEYTIWVTITDSNVLSNYEFDINNESCVEYVAEDSISIYDEHVDDPNRPTPATILDTSEYHYIMKITFDWYIEGE